MDTEKSTVVDDGVVLVDAFVSSSISYIVLRASRHMVPMGRDCINQDPSLEREREMGNRDRYVVNGSLEKGVYERGARKRERICHTSHQRRGRLCGSQEESLPEGLRLRPSFS